MNFSQRDAISLTISQTCLSLSEVSLTSPELGELMRLLGSDTGGKNQHISLQFCPAFQCEPTYGTGQRLTLMRSLLMASGGCGQSHGDRM